MLRKCLIANRGEIAVRIIHTCREMGIATVAVYAADDADAQHTLLADEAVALEGETPRETYLNIEQLVWVAQETGCDAVHPGYGFLSENAAFAQAVQDAGITWVGPQPQTIAIMGSKTEARALMAEVGVPIVPGFDCAGLDEGEIAALAEDIGYPILLKASAGGGGKGIRIVQTAADLPDALASAANEAAKAFGDDTLFIEKYLPSARHIEVQVIGDHHGNLVHLYERECSLQRRHQKILEESPAVNLRPSVRGAICTAALQAANAVAYVNAGTVECLLTPDDSFYFLEMNTRLQVEHPVTEQVTGIDLVRWQLAIAAGERLPLSQAEIQQRGHAIECRVYAEDPRNSFLPETGELLNVQLPNMPGVRVDCGVKQGDVIGVQYDPMLAKVIAYGETREIALVRMQAALAQTVLLGITTNQEFLQYLLQHPAVQQGDVDTRWVEANLDALLPPNELDHLSLIAAAIADLEIQQDLTYASVDPWDATDDFRL